MSVGVLSDILDPFMLITGVFVANWTALVSLESSLCSMILR